MASYTSSNTEPERWAKIVEGADSGRHPEIMIDDGKLVAVSAPSIASARIQAFLTDVFKDGDNEWFSTASDPVDPSKGKAADDGQPESSKKKKISLTKQRENARQEKKDKGLVKARAEMSKEGFLSDEWATICLKVCTLSSPGIFLEGGKVVATDHTIQDAQRKLQCFTAIALGQDSKPYGGYHERGAGYPSRRS